MHLLRRCHYFWTVSLLQRLGLYFVCLGFFVLFCFFILVVSSQLVTTKNVDIGIWLICFGFVVLPQQFKKLKKNQQKTCPATVFLRFWNLIILCRRADKAWLDCSFTGFGVLVVNKLNETPRSVCDKGQEHWTALECSWKLPARWSWQTDFLLYLEKLFISIRHTYKLSWFFSSLPK